LKIHQLDIKTTYFFNGDLREETCESKWELYRASKRK